MPDLIVEKRIFELPSFTTLGGAVIKQVRVGWESYGELNTAKDNAILSCTKKLLVDLVAFWRRQDHEALPLWQGREA
ncbi:MAG: homoserine O-acetyltransferase [Microvirga sp.]|jgi:hypothetical protein|nr:homoserine O-acetyltransferase [Microvirga sp.]